MADFIVHSVVGSPFGQAVLAALEEKHAAWSLAAIAPRETKTAAHVARHPFGRVPVLEHGDFTLYETQAILRYIDRVLPAPALTPADPRGAARMDQLLGINDWYLFQGVASVIGFQRVILPRFLGGNTDVAAVEAAMPRAHTVFGILAGLLGTQPYFAGDMFSLADLMLAPQLSILAQTPEWAVLTAPHANLAGWLAKVQARPSFAATGVEQLFTRAAA